MKDGFGREIEVNQTIVVCHRTGSHQFLTRYWVLKVEQNRVYAEFIATTGYNKKRKVTRVWLRVPRNITDVTYG
jgi:hypothetical protein